MTHRAALVRADVLVGVLVTVLLGACRTTGPVRYFQPDVPYGGRAAAIAEHPTNERVFIAAAETGGLFRTTTGGRLWAHVEGLPTFVLRDVAYRPDDPRTVLATSALDTRADNSAGIWRSTDGGRTWSRPPTAAPPASDRCPSPAAAYGVAFAPTGGRVYVGTDCGLAVSDDGGATWAHGVLDPAVPVGPNQLQNKVLAVLATESGRAYALGADGVWALDPATGAWSRASGVPGLVNRLESDPNRIAVSPFSDRHVFVALNVDTDGNGSADRRRAFFSVGGSWRLLCPSGGPCDTAELNRVAFVETALSVSDEDDQFDVYFGDGVNVHRRTYRHEPLVFRSVSDWRELDDGGGGGPGHDDNADIAFDAERRDPVLMAGDGGILRTTDRGGSWAMFGNGPFGFAALQINEVVGSEVLGRDDLAYKGTDLYFSTQDNSIWASGDGGRTWPNDVKWEGGALQVRPSSYDREGANVTGFSCGACRKFDAEPVLARQTDWRSPTDASGADVSRGDPVYLRPIGTLSGPDGNYRLQNSAVREGTNTFQVTADRGRTYAEVADVDLDLRGGIQVAGRVFDPVVYVPVRRGPGERIGLVRIRDLFGYGAPTVEDADAGIEGLATFPTMFAWYTVFGVSPDGQRLIAVDVVDQAMKVSRDGGQTWAADPALTAAVTDGGRFLFGGTRFGWAPYTQAQAVRFDPRRPGHVLIGTQQNGVLRSTDDGASWRRVPGTERITNVSDFYFHRDGSVVVSTYGLGLWKLVFGREPARLPRPVPDDPFPGEPLPFDPPTEPARMLSVPGLYVQVSAPTMAGGMARVRPGETVRVFVRGLRPPAEGGPVSLSVGDRVVDQALDVSPDGTVRADVPVQSLPGHHVVVRVQQGNGPAAEWDESVVLVVNSDDRGEAETKPDDDPQDGDPRDDRQDR